MNAFKLEYCVESTLYKSVLMFAYFKPTMTNRKIELSFVV